METAGSILGDTANAILLAESTWSEPATVVNVVMAMITASSLMYGAAAYRWSKKESRLAALSEVLEQMLRCVQLLNDANRMRQKVERLKLAFPDPSQAKEAAERVNGMIDTYGELIRSSGEFFRAAEASIGARSFRFPDRVASMLRSTFKGVSDLSRLVDDGMFAQADLQVAKFKDDYNEIRKIARGWRLADPLEGIRRHFTRQTPEASDDDDLTEEQMQELLRLVHRRCTTQGQNTFAVHPPRKLLEQPEIASSDNVVEELGNSVFSVVFQDGTAKMLTLTELMVFTFQLILAAQQLAEASRVVEAMQPKGELEINFKTQFSTKLLMRPESVKLLLTKNAFSNVASDS